MAIRNFSSQFVCVIAFYIGQKIIAKMIHKPLAKSFEENGLND